MTYEQFIDEYNQKIDWLVRSIYNCSSNFIEEQKYVYALKCCYSFKQELLLRYDRRKQETVNDKLTMNFNQLYGLCKKHIASINDNNSIASLALFLLCQSLRYYFPKENDKLNKHNYISSISHSFELTHTDGEIKPIGKLNYRNLNWPIYYDENSSTYYAITIRNKKKYVFSIEWDWYYEVDKFVDLFA
jgi:hypothetical protein